uniref:hypothetical protein n=1 Tax=Pseudoclavibacter sp. RFBI5 TaxID=2080578 RepID=UPI000CE8DF75|nr:hypothetical protein [Pseudoclavibacter sp. RFBI5]
MTTRGEITTMLLALGQPLSHESAQAALTLVGETVEDAYKEGRASYLMLSAFDDGTVFSLKNGKLDKIVMRIQEESRYGTYPRPASIVEGIDATSDRAAVVSVLGEPASSRPDWDMFGSGKRRIHVRYRDGLVARITALVP